MTDAELQAIKDRANLLKLASDWYGVSKLLDYVEELKVERDAYKRAKSENDDRFMSERDEARHRLETARDALRHIASTKPVCEGCMLIDISLLEHYRCIAEQALRE